MLALIATALVSFGLGGLLMFAITSKQLSRTFRQGRISGYRATNRLN